MLHVYHGDGKGKTTCAIGLAVRGAGAGMNILIIQFLKGSKTGELDSLAKIPNIKILRNSKDYGFINTMTKDQLDIVKNEHNANLTKAFKLTEEQKCDMLILDELTYVYDMNLIDKEKIDDLIKNASKNIEIVITGRNPDKLFLESADYVTEMKLQKHPFEKGISARKGIEF